MLKTCFGAIAATLLLATSALSAEPYRRGGDYFPNLQVVNQHGKAANFYEDKIKGKIVIVSFIFTSCQDICPITTARMAQLEERLGDAMGKDIFFYSMTVDPERDTPSKMKAFSEAFSAGPGWEFLTGTLEDIRAINSSLGDNSKNLFDHRNEIVIGNDRTGVWRRDSLFSDLERIVMDIRYMDPNYRATDHNIALTTADAGIAFPDTPGLGMYRKICAPCHTVGVGDRVGPDLRGVTDRRSKDWLVSFLMDPDAMRKKKDPTVTELMGRFPAVRMPKMNLTHEDATDMISYLKKMNDALVDEETSTAAAAKSASHDHKH